MRNFHGRPLALFVSVWQLWFFNGVRTQAVDPFIEDPEVTMSPPFKSKYCLSGLLTDQDLLTFSVKVPKFRSRFLDELSIIYKLGKGDHRELLCIINQLRSVPCPFQPIIGCYCSQRTFESTTITVNVSARQYAELKVQLVEKTGKTLELDVPQYETYASPIITTFLNGEILPAFGTCSRTVEGESLHTLQLCTKGLSGPELIVEIEGEDQNLTISSPCVELSQYLGVSDYVAKFSYRDGCQRSKTLNCSIKTTSPRRFWHKYYPWMLPLVTGIIVLPTTLAYVVGRSTNKKPDSNEDNRSKDKYQTRYIMPFM